MAKPFAENFKLNPRFEDELFASKLPEGLGKATAYTAAAAAGAYVSRCGGKGGGSSGSGTAATALVASQELAGQMFEDATENGATLEQAFRARDLGQMLGLIEAIPIVPLLNKLAPEARGQTLRLLVEAMKSGTEAGVKEAATTLGRHLAASKIVAYDPDRKIYEGIIDGAKVSFTASSILQAIVGAMTKQ